MSIWIQPKFKLHHPGQATCSSHDAYARELWVPPSRVVGAHIPWEDTADFLKPLQRKKFLQNCWWRVQRNFQGCEGEILDSMRQKGWNLQGTDVCKAWIIAPPCPPPPKKKKTFEKKNHMQKDGQEKCIKNEVCHKWSWVHRRSSFGSFCPWCAAVLRGGRCRGAGATDLWIVLTTLPETNMTLENSHFQQEIHLQMVDFPLSS